MGNNDGVFEKAIELYEWLKKDSLVGAYKQITRATERGEGCAYAQKIKTMFYECDQNGMTCADMFKKKIIELAKEFSQENG